MGCTYYYTIYLIIVGSVAGLAGVVALETGLPVAGLALVVSLLGAALVTLAVHHHETSVANLAIVHPPQGLAVLDHPGLGLYGACIGL